MVVGPTRATFGAGYATVRTFLLFVDAMLPAEGFGPLAVRPLVCTRLPKGPSYHVWTHCSCIRPWPRRCDRITYLQKQPASDLSSSDVFS